MVASGTATVEAALIGNPFIAVYRLSDFSYAVASRLVDLPHVAMVNLIAGDRIVPELIQDDFTPQNIVRVLQPLLEETGYRVQMIEELKVFARHSIGSHRCPTVRNQHDPDS